MTTRIEAHGVKGMKSTRWRKTFKNYEALAKWAEENSAEIHATRYVPHFTAKTYPVTRADGRIVRVTIPEKE